MSIKNGVWHDAKMDPPGADYVNKPVLAVRIIGTGKAPSCTWDGKWNKRGVILWMPLPKIPGEEGL